MRHVYFCNTAYASDYDVVRRVLAEVGIRSLSVEGNLDEGGATVTFDCPNPLVMAVSFVMEGFIRHHFIESASWQDGDGPTADKGVFGSWLRDTQDAVNRGRELSRLTEAVDAAGAVLDKVRKA